MLHLHDKRLLCAGQDHQSHKPGVKIEDHRGISMNPHLLMEFVGDIVDMDHHLTVDTRTHHLHLQGIDLHQVHTYFYLEIVNA